MVRISTAADQAVVITAPPELLRKCSRFIRGCLIGSYILFGINLLLIWDMVIDPVPGGLATTCILSVIIALYVRLFRCLLGRLASNPEVRLTPEGITTDDLVRHGMIPWDEIVVVRASRTLGMPMLCFETRDYTKLRARMGDGGRYLYFAWMPGRLEFLTLPWASSGTELAARIEAYRVSAMEGRNGYDGA